MRQLLTILTFCLTLTSYTQTNKNIDYFPDVRNNDDSTFKYFLSLLDKLNSTEPYKYIFLEKVSEKVGDYYKSGKDYLKAIAYYDSADTKYRNLSQICGNGYYIEFIPRRYKIAQCYMELKNPKKAIATLTPHIFDDLGSHYFDSTMFLFYVQTLNLLYSEKEIKDELDNAIAKMDFKTYYRWTLDSSAKYINVYCKLTLFDTDIQLADYETSADKVNVPFLATKEVFIRKFKDLSSKLVD